MVSYRLCLLSLSLMVYNLEATRNSGRSYIDFLNADISILSNAKITFSQGGATDLKKAFGSRT